MAITEVRIWGLPSIKARDLVLVRKIHPTGAVTPDNILPYAFALGRNWLEEKYPDLWQYGDSNLRDEPETWTFNDQFQWNDAAWEQYRVGAGSKVPLMIEWDDPDEDARREAQRVAREAARIDCGACDGTGVYVGFAERDGAAVVCTRCGGEGAAHKDDPRFTGRKVRKGVEVVAYSQGIVLDVEWALKTGGVSYADFLNGVMPVRTVEEA